MKWWNEDLLVKELVNFVNTKLSNYTYPGSYPLWAKESILDIIRKYSDGPKENHG